MTTRTDNFNRTDTTNNVGTPSDAGSAWTQSVGTWGISTNAGYESGGLGNQNLAVLESSISDADIQVTVTTLGSDNGVVARFADSNNYLLFIYTGGTGYRMFKNVGGLSQLGSTVSGTGANGDVYKFSVNGSSLTGSVNGTPKVTATDSAGSTNTQHGLRSFADTAQRFDTFSIAAAGGGTVDASDARTPFHVSRVGMGLRRAVPQRFADTFKAVTEFTAKPDAPFRPGRGPGRGPMLLHRMFPKQFNSVTVNAYNLPAATGVFTLTGIAAALQHNDDLVASSGTFTLSGIASNLLHGYLVSAAQGVFVLTGIATGFLRSYVVSAAKGTFSLTGVAANLLAGRVVNAALGTFVLNGQAANLLHGYALSADSGAFVLTGNVAVLTYSGAVAGPARGQSNPFMSSPGRMMNRP